MGTGEEKIKGMARRRRIIAGIRFREGWGREEGLSKGMISSSPQSGDHYSPMRLT